MYRVHPRESADRTAHAPVKGDPLLAIGIRQLALVTPMRATALFLPTDAACLRASKGDGAWRQVHFDPYAESFAGGGDGAQPALLFCTDAGALGTCGAAAPPGGDGGAELSARALYQEAASGITSFAVEAAGGQDMFAGTEQECLVYIRRPAG